jgi:hypothetical protein
MQHLRRQIAAQEPEARRVQPLAEAVEQDLLVGAVEAAGDQPIDQFPYKLECRPRPSCHGLRGNPVRRTK